jgi:hypothetical protein
MINCLRHPIREHFWSKLRLALDGFLWLWCLPLLLHIYTVPALLQRMSGRAQFPDEPALDLDQAARVVTLVCSLRPFRSRPFPRRCLCQSLVLYRALIRMGYRVQIHFGVRKEQRVLTGHSWVTENGNPVADTAHGEPFKVVYSYASGARSSTA